MIDEKKIEEADMTNIPKRIFVIDYQLEQCEVDGISDARLNARPFHTTNGKLVEYLCLDTLWHDASEEPKVKDTYILYEYKIYEGKFGFKTYHVLGYASWEKIVRIERITRWLYIEDLMKGGK